MTSRGIVLFALSAALCFSMAAAAAVPDVMLVTDTSGSAVTDAWVGFLRWVRESYRRAPALMLGVGFILAIPPLALLGLLMRRLRRPQPKPAPVEVAVPAEDAEQAEDTAPATGRPGDGMTWPVDAWLDLADGLRFPIGREMLRIGRDEDSDLVLRDEAVHRNHAVIHRTEDAEIIIVDLSGDGGNGVMLNGKRVSRARLRNGDKIGLGRTELGFASRRA